MSPARGATGRDGLPAASSTVLLVVDYADESSDALRTSATRSWPRIRGRTPSSPSPGSAPTSSWPPRTPAPPGFGLLQRLRDARPGRTVPVILVTCGDEHEVLTGLRLGADDSCRAAVSAWSSPPGPRQDRPSAGPGRPGQPGPAHRPARRGTLVDEAGRELDRGRRRRARAASASSRSRRCLGCSTASVRVPATQIATQVTELLGGSPEPLERLGLDRPAAARAAARDRPDRARCAPARARPAGRRARASPWATSDVVRVTPVTGWAASPTPTTGHELLARAVTALRAAADHLDLLPVGGPRPSRPRPLARARRRGSRDRTDRLRLPAQFLATLVVGVGLPFAPTRSSAARLDVSGVAYWVRHGRAAHHRRGTIWLEGFYALDPQRPPDEPGAPYPPATAVIAAYLPNEAATIMDDGRGVPARRLPGPLQILVAYNTPSRWRSRRTCARWPAGTRGSCRSRWRTAPPRRRTSTPR